MQKLKQAEPRVIERAATAFRTNTRGRKLDPGALLNEGAGIDFGALEEMAEMSVLSATQFDRNTVIGIAKTAAFLETNEISQRAPLAGKIVVTAFFEASTRTRLSFESAIHRLVGAVLSVPDGGVTGIKKGESIEDIGEMLNTYGDAVVLRHPETDSIAKIKESLSTPIINAGNGAGEHPTQALLDWYALFKWRPSLTRATVPASDRIHLGIIGRPTRMRAVRSFLELSLLLGNAVSRITLISEDEDPLDEDLARQIADSGIPFDTATRYKGVLPHLDAIYMNSITLKGDGYERLDNAFKLDADSPLKPSSVIMHPLARGEELDVSLDRTPHNLYFAQAAGAVFVRQVVLSAVLARTGALADAFRGI